MNGINAFINRFFSAILKLVLALAASVFLVSLLMAALIAMFVITVWSLLTGRKPAPARVFGQFRQASQRYTGRTWPGGSGRPGPGNAGGDVQDVVDVPAREVPQSPDAKDKPGSDGPRSGPMARVQL